MFDQDYISKNQQVFLPVLEEKQVELFIKREDQIHSEVSGNKFRKLKYNLQKAEKEEKNTLLTFGGAFSNHILATASAGKQMGFQTIGVIRGKELGIDVSKTLASNTTLRKASEYGMQFEFLSRTDYRKKTSSQVITSLQNKWGDFYVIPEGGTNELAVKGCEEILTKEDSLFDFICSCVGTGGTIAGLIRSVQPHQQIVGFPALKGNFLNDEIRKFVGNRKNWTLISNYHFGGYGKYQPELIHFINEFLSNTHIPLDPIYTGKMLFGMLDLIQNDYFSKGSKILAIHSGGLQGIEGFNQKLKKNTELRIHT